MEFEQITEISEETKTETTNNEDVVQIPEWDLTPPFDNLDRSEL